MKIKYIFLLCLVFVSVSLYAKDISTISESGKFYAGINLENYIVRKVTDRSKQVFFTGNKKFGIGITEGGEWTVHSLKDKAYDKRLSLKGLSGITVYDRNNPVSLKRFDITETDKTGFKGECADLGLSLDLKIESFENYLSVSASFTSDRKNSIVLDFAYPMDASNALVGDRQIWISDIYNAYVCDEAKEFSNLSVDKNVSLYPFSAVMNGTFALSMATGPSDRDSKFVFYREVKSFANEYRLDFEKGETVNIKYVIYEPEYAWGFRSAYDIYTQIYKDSFPEKADTKENNVYEIKNFDISFKELMKYDAYRVTFPIEQEKLDFLKCVAKNKKVFCKIRNDSFRKDYALAVFYGFVPEVKDTTQEMNSIILKYRKVYDILQRASWHPVSMAESKNDILSERYIDGDRKYVVGINPNKDRKVTFFILYEYNGPIDIKELAENTKYKIANKTVDITLASDQICLFEY